MRGKSPELEGSRPSGPEAVVCVSIGLSGVVRETRRLGVKGRGL